NVDFAFNIGLLLMLSLLNVNDKVNQSPAEMLHNREETAKINCSHSIQDYDYIYWYKLTEDRQMQLLGYMSYNSGNPEVGSGVMIEGGARKDQTCTLTIKGLGLNSSAVYFCAASLHSESCHCSSV
uniref:Immunoglobulin V-set domain-containing protein n=1 Tax=Mola mola TaxID=94237 RepID=A0A3Q4BI65_MOLML